MVAADNWVSDNTSFLVGTILGVLGIITGAFFYQLAKRTKTLDWELLDHDAIVKVAAAQSVDLDVRWKGRQVEHPALATIRVVNSGNEPISASDMVEPLKISVGPGALLSADIVDTPTDDFLSGSAVQGPDHIAFTPKLLNPSESVSVQLFLDAQSTDISVTVRVAGLSRPIGDLRDMAAAKADRGLYRLIPVAVLAAAFPGYAAYEVTRGGSPSLLLAAAVYFSMLAISVVYFVRNRKNLF